MLLHPVVLIKTNPVPMLLPTASIVLQDITNPLLLLEPLLLPTSDVSTLLVMLDTLMSPLDMPLLLEA